MQKIGVFVCHCGSNIKSVVDVGKVVEALRIVSGVAFSAEYPYLCSEAGQNLVVNAIRENGLTGVVVAACSPRMHEATFRKACEKAGLNGYMVEIANIREQNSWVHKDVQEATDKAIRLTAMAVAKVHKNSPLLALKSPVTKRALVIGGGIAGIQTALDIADAGFLVDLVETTPSIGGKMAMLDKTFPTLDCAACILTPKMVDAAAHPGISLHTYSEVEKVEGFVGNFSVTVKKKARSVSMERCTGCGDCYAKCPVKNIPSEFDAGIGLRRAVYTPFAQAVPNVPVIDRKHCIHFKTGKCGLCEKICQPKAVEFNQEDEVFTEKYGAIIVATGYEVTPLTKFGEFSYHDSKDVITSLELERLMNAAGPSGGKLIRPSDNNPPKSVTFIQCVASRDATKRGKTYCSKICCMYTAKHAIIIKEKYPDVEVNVFYIDVRTPGKNFDEFYRRAVENYGVNYIKGQVGKVADMGDSLLVQAVDMLEGKRLSIKTELVVLAAAIKPHDSAKGISAMVSSGVDANGFFTEAHPKLKPVESATAGIFLSGVCHGPKDIPETVAQASAAAAKAIILLSKDELLTNPCTAKTDENLCNGCGLCENVCPYKSIGLEEGRLEALAGQPQLIAVVNAATCQGCGACAVTCPSGAMDLQGFTHIQIISEVDALVS